MRSICSSGIASSDVLPVVDANGVVTLLVLLHRAFAFGDLPALLLEDQRPDGRHGLKDRDSTVLDLGG